MNTPNDLRWLLFATVPTHGYINFSTPIARGIVHLCRRAVDSVRRVVDASRIATASPRDARP